MDLKFLMVVVVGVLILTTDIVCGRKIVGEENLTLEYDQGFSKIGCDSKTSVSCGVRDSIHREGGHVWDYIQQGIQVKLRGEVEDSGRVTTKGRTIQMGDDSGSTNTWLDSRGPINGTYVNKTSNNSIYNGKKNQIVSGSYPNTQSSNGMIDNEGGGGGGGGGGGSGGGGGGGGGGK
ncbi:uncharacterized protein LOC111897986 [Lactuca sativa]|uniref:uncharacterized protein LOC111897986 n=1 Tax=Lactuca sativa TaxID=4236 RepID=UPI000CCA3976|nr:uncharacterized protein LOC111897986 [Lactuca sativa]